MPKTPTLKSKRAPAGWDLVEPTLTQLTEEIREIETKPFTSKTEPDTYWEIFRLVHQRSRFLYETFYKKKEISRELYEYCLREGWADKNLIAKWKKKGYERLCCNLCIQKKEHNFGGTCICRVPKNSLEEGKLIQCKHCGCRGCASGD